MAGTREPRKHQRLGPEALLVAYTLSRLDRSLLDALGYRTWTEAYSRVGNALDVPFNSIKLLRDEFDVFFPNGRRGWIGREPHPSRLAVLHEFEHVSDPALIEVVRRVLARDVSSVAEILDLIATPATAAANVAERLLNGRRGEEFFMAACQDIVGVSPASLVDLRASACGYDFESTDLPGIALEVKGIKKSSGGILFTEREWIEAEKRRRKYLVVVVGNLSSEPLAKVFPDPARTFEATSQIVRSSSTVWSAQASVG